MIYVSTVGNKMVFEMSNGPRAEVARREPVPAIGTAGATRRELAVDEAFVSVVRCIGASKVLT